MAAILASRLSDWPNATSKYADLSCVIFNWDVSFDKVNYFNVHFVLCMYILHVVSYLHVLFIHGRWCRDVHDSDEDTFPCSIRIEKKRVVVPQTTRLHFLVVRQSLLSVITNLQQFKTALWDQLRRVSVVN